ncbi:MAG: hypothetical protein NBV67_14465 [Tagaea sp.]|nr:hypothetical protein [Tagaea sp.]
MANVELDLLRKKLAELEARRVVDAGGGGGDDPPMESRVTRLEVEFEHVRRDLDQMNGKLDKLGERLSVLPTKGDLWIMIGTVGGISLAIISIFVAVLTYLAPMLGKA